MTGPREGDGGRLGFGDAVFWGDAEGSAFFDGEGVCSFFEELGVISWRGPDVGPRVWVSSLFVSLRLGMMILDDVVSCGLAVGCNLLSSLWSEYVFNLDPDCESHLRCDLMEDDDSLVVFLYTPARVTGGLIDFFVVVDSNALDLCSLLCVRRSLSLRAGILIFFEA